MKRWIDHQEVFYNDIYDQYEAEIRQDISEQRNHHRNAVLNNELTQLERGFMPILDRIEDRLANAKNELNRSRQ